MEDNQQGHGAEGLRDSDEDTYMSTPPDGATADEGRTDDDFDYAADEEANQAWAAPTAGNGVSYAAAKVNGSVNAAEEQPCPVDVQGILQRTMAAHGAPAKQAPVTQDTPPVATQPTPTQPTPSSVPPTTGAPPITGPPAGLGLGGLGKLPPRPKPTPPTQQPTQPTPDSNTPPAPSGLGGMGLGGGLPTLPPRTKPAAAPPAAPGAASTTPPTTGTTPAAAPPAQGAPLGLSGGLQRPPMMVAPGVAPAAAAPAPAPGGGAGAQQQQGSSGGGGPAQPVPEEPAHVQKLRRTVQTMRVNLLRCSSRLGQPMRSSITQQVMYRLDLAERLQFPPRGGQPQRRAGALFEAAQEEAEEQEENNTPLNLSVTVLLLGPAGSGKTTTMYNLLDGPRSPTTIDPTTKVNIVQGTYRGFKVKFIDTPGLHMASSQLARNMDVLNAAKKAFNKHKPDLVLYVDRMDELRGRFGDLPLLRSISDKFGASIWFNTILLLTHGGAPPLESTNGPMMFEVYMQTRTQYLQTVVRRAAGDQRLLNPVGVVENSRALCTTDDRGELLLPHDGKAWRPFTWMLLLSSKLLADADDLLSVHKQNNQQSNAMQQLLRMGLGGIKLPPITYLVSQFVTSKRPRKAPEDERELKRDDELDELPAEVRKEEVRKRRDFIRARAEEAKQDATMPPTLLPTQDPQVQPSFDIEPTMHHYRSMEPASGSSFICRPYPDQPFDHDDGVDNCQVEFNTMVRSRGQYVGGVPTYAMASFRKDKDHFLLQGESEASLHHSSKWATTATGEVQALGQDMMYTTKLETRMKVHPKAKVAVGVLASKLKEGLTLPYGKGPMAYGVKLEQKYKVTPSAKLSAGVASVSTKTRMGRDTAHSLLAELRLRGVLDEGSDLVLGASAMHHRKELAYSGNMAAQFNVTPESMVQTRVKLDSKANGSMSVRVASHDHPELAYSMIVPVLGMLWARLRGGGGQDPMMGY